jgi:hypothetical protein
MKNTILCVVTPCDFVRTDVSEDRIASIMSVTRIGDIVFLRSMFQLLVTVSVDPSPPILVILKIWAICSSETSVLIRGTRRIIREDGILLSLIFFVFFKRGYFIACFELLPILLSSITLPNKKIEWLLLFLLLLLLLVNWVVCGKAPTGPERSVEPDQRSCREVDSAGAYEGCHGRVSCLTFMCRVARPWGADFLSNLLPE